MTSKMYMVNPTTAAELSRVSGSGTSWIVGGSSMTNLAKEDITHEPLDSAPPAALEVARRLHETLAGAILPASESDTMGRVVVINAQGGQRLPDKQVLLQALGLKDSVVVHEDEEPINLLEEMTLATKDDFSSLSWLGYTLDDEDYLCENEDTNNSDIQKAKRSTELMASELENHFEMNFSEKIVCAPVLYGGRAKDGNIVAVLSMRVWT